MTPSLCAHSRVHSGTQQQPVSRTEGAAWHVTSLVALAGCRGLQRGGWWERPTASALQGACQAGLLTLVPAGPHGGEADTFRAVIVGRALCVGS